MATTKVFVDPTKPAVGARLAAFVAAQSAAAVAARGKFVVAISGGSLPGMLAAGLFEGDSPAAPGIAWDKWHVFFADERVVPLDHEDSNFRGCDEALFQKASGLPRAQIHTLTMGTPEEAAAAYQAELEATLGDGSGFDLILLGMGPDGHTASLFPGHALLSETRVSVAPISDSPKMPPQRITLTYPVINAARAVAFVAAGGSKAENLPKVIAPGAQVTVGDAAPQTLAGAATAAASADERLPAGRVQPASGALYWFVDSAAAVGLALEAAGSGETKL